MIEYFDEFDYLPLRGKISITSILLNGRSHYADWDLSNQSRNRFDNVKSKNAKAKHRKRYRHRN